MDDGSEVQVEPDLKAIQQVLSIMDRRAKLLGMEQNNVNIQMDVSARVPIRATLAGAVQVSASNQFSPEAEAKKLLALMGKSGVLPMDYIESILGEQKELNPITDAEIIDTDEESDE